MSCRVGISTDPESRKSYWQRQHPSLRQWEILSRHATKTAAQAEENRVAAQHGCRHAPGGADALGAWQVYHFYY